MSVLVTGGAGYIGSHCVKQLLKQGREVVVLDDLSTGHQEMVLTPHFVQGSTTDSSLLASIFKTYPITAVMHFAASAYVGESVTHPEKYYFNNVYGTLLLLQAMRAAAIPHFIFSSTCATYGVPQYTPLDEAHPQTPINPYGYTKRVVEEILKDYAHAYGLKHVIFRYFNAAGADLEGQIGEWHEPETHLIPLVLQAALGKRAGIEILGTDYPTPDGTCIRDYIHVNDIAQAHILGLQYLEAGGDSECFNIGSQTGYSVREVIETCQAVTQREIPVIEASRRAGDPPALVASASKIQAVLGWQPAFTSLSDLIESAWFWEKSRMARSL
jgi:UDP-glucose 4-epimerase